MKHALTVYRSEGEIIPPAGPVDQLARTIYDSLNALDPPPEDLPWEALREAEREIYRTCLERVILEWELVVEARSILNR